MTSPNPDLAALELERVRVARAAEKAAYAERRALAAGCSCKGSGQALRVWTRWDGLKEMLTCPCPTCRPEDHEAFLEGLRPKR